MKLPAGIGFLLVVACGASRTHPPNGDIHDAMSSDDQESELFMVLRQFAQPGSQGERAFSRMSGALSATLTALPKNAYGRLGPEAARYALQNYFAKRHGWRLKGLSVKNGGSHSWGALHELSVLQNKAPTLLSALSDSEVLEHGFSEKEVAALALVLEILIYDDSVPVLDKAYESLNRSTSELLPLASFRQVIQAYVAMYTHGKTEQLPPHTKEHLFKMSSEDTIPGDNDVFSTLSHREWFYLKAFVEDALQRVVQSDDLDRNLLRSDRFSYEHAWKVVELLSERFGEHQNRDCLDMKHALQEVDPAGQGRVPLKYFYLQGQHLKHWFEEAPGYLMKIGALDQLSVEDSDPHVLVANYIKGPGNCVASFKHHAICCLVECADVMEVIEQEVGAPRADPAKLLSIVRGISTQTVRAPRELHEELVSKLYSIADRSYGEIPLYGRLFAQWLHFAFPYECTYPHLGQRESEFEQDTMDESQLVTREEFSLVNELSQLIPADQKFMDTWIDSEKLFFEDGGDGIHNMLDWMLTLDTLLATSFLPFEVIIFATLFLVGFYLVPMLRKRNKSAGKAVDFDDDFGEFEDSKKVWQKPRKSKELSKEMMKDAIKKDVSIKPSKTKPMRDQDELQNQKSNRAKRKKDSIVKGLSAQCSQQLDSVSLVQQKSHDEIELVSEQVADFGSGVVEDAIFKNNQPESEPEDAIAGVALPTNHDEGSWVPATKSQKHKNKKRILVAATPETSHQDKEVQDVVRQADEEVQSVERRPDELIADEGLTLLEPDIRMATLDQPCLSQVDELTESAVQPPQWFPPPGLVHGFGHQVCSSEHDEIICDKVRSTGHEVCSSEHDEIICDEVHCTGSLPSTPVVEGSLPAPSIAPSAGPPPGLEMFGPPPGVFNARAEENSAMSSPMRVEPASLMTTQDMYTLAPEIASSGFRREEMLAAQMQELAHQLELERQARGQLEFLLCGGTSYQYHW